jgi:hypothetical protein
VGKIRKTPEGQPLLVKNHPRTAAEQSGTRGLGPHQHWRQGAKSGYVTGLVFKDIRRCHFAEENRENGLKI